MITAPFPRRRDGIHVSLGGQERTLLRGLLSQLVELLSAGDPEDPAFARLLPPAYADDEEASAEFRRLTVDDLTAGKIERANAVAETLGHDKKTPLDEAGEQAWLRTLTDLRLGLATRIGVTADGFEPTSDHGVRTSRHIYDWLGYLQESLVRALSR